MKLLLLYLSMISYVGCSSLNQDILTPPDKDTSLIESLNYSPGGKYFYSNYVMQFQPVHIKKASQHWPIVKQFNNSTFIKETLSDVIVHPNNINQSLAYAISNKVDTTYLAKPDSNFLKTLYLPYVLLCTEYLKKSLSISIHLNNIPQTSTPSVINEDIIIIAVDTTLLVTLLYAGKDVQTDPSLLNVGINKFNNDLVNKISEVLPGDQLYIPQNTRFLIKPLHGETPNISFIKIAFNLFTFQHDDSLPYSQAIASYKTFLESQEQNIVCNNTLITMKDALTVDFNKEVDILHLRIPKRNEKPEDVTLASGYKMPVLGLGTALLNETTYDAVKYALSVDYRLFDLAYSYPLSETGFAKAFSESGIPRADVFIVTKLHPKFLGYNETLHAIELSLENLNTSYIDLYLIHSMECDDFLMKCEKGEPKGTWKESWRAMEFAVTKGKIRSIGVSNFYDKDINSLVNWSVQPISVIQNWFDPFNQDLSTRSLCRKYNIRYMGYSTLGNRWHYLGLSFNPVTTSEVLSSISGHHDYIVSHVVLRWAIHNNVTVIPRSSNPNHIAQNIRSLEIKLHESDINSINNLSAWDDDDDDILDKDETIYGNEIY